MYPGTQDTLEGLVEETQVEEDPTEAHAYTDSEEEGYNLSEQYSSQEEDEMGWRR